MVGRESTQKAREGGWERHSLTQGISQLGRTLETRFQGNALAVPERTPCFIDGKLRPRKGKDLSKITQLLGGKVVDSQTRTAQ